MEVSMHEINCTVCNMSFWITYDTWQNYVRHHKNITCPNGHDMWVSMHGELMESSYQRDDAIYRLQTSKDKLYRSNCALRGVITRMKKQKN